MAANYVLLEKITVGAAGASSVTFSGIPQTGYTDLVIKTSSRTNRASTNDYFSMRFNGSTSGYTDKSLYGDGSVAQSETNNGTNNAFMFVSEGGNNTANTFGNHEIYIPNYTSANYKSVSSDGVSENNSSSAIQGLNANLWSNTAAITSIVLFSIGTYVQYSTFYLYGVAKLGTTPAIVPYATGGDTIMTDGTYWYHTFVSSGTFTPAKALSCDVLVVAGGGGGGGNYYGGGGGAGGLLAFTSQSLAINNYTATVGAGGAGGTSGTGIGTIGGNSQLGSLTACVGGGFGGSYSNGATGGTGGSGGGGAANNGGTRGAATSGQGYAGGLGFNNTGPAAGGGGGGGAGAQGGDSVNNGAAGDGGNGLNTWSSWLSVVGLGVSGYVAGGGGGVQYADSGAGGAGGGGTGGSTTGTNNGTAGTVNTGGGGGGGTNIGIGGAGGSGLIIVRYAV